MGAALHDLISAVLNAGVRQPELDFLILTVARHSLGYAWISDRSSARHRLLTPLRIYFKLFEPDLGWSYVGSEITAGNACFDLVWRHDGGSVRVDEIKSGRLRPDGGSLDDQVTRELAAGRELYGEDFCGVRVCVLAVPDDSFHAHPDGTRTPLFA
jgi:hypothetical protein